MEPERLDFSALSPDPAGFEARVRAIMRAAAPELARRAQREGVLVMLGQWLRPVLAAAAVVGVIATGALMVSLSESAPPRLQGVAHQLGVAEPVLQWIDEERAPTMSDLEMALMEDGR